MPIFSEPDAPSPRTRRITNTKLVHQLMNSRFVHEQLSYFPEIKSHILRNSFYMPIDEVML